MLIDGMSELFDLDQCLVLVFLERFISHGQHFQLLLHAPSLVSQLFELCLNGADFSILLLVLGLEPFDLVIGRAFSCSTLQILQFDSFLLQTGLERSYLLVVELKHLFVELEIALALTDRIFELELARDELALRLW